jgi:hypothetical protein
VILNLHETNVLARRPRTWLDAFCAEILKDEE